MCWEQQEVLEICLDLLEMCIFMDSVRRRFFVPVYIGHIWNDILGYPVKTCEACSLCHHYTDHFFRVPDTLLHLPDRNDRVYGARHGAIATFLPTTAAVIFGCLAFLVDMSAVILAYYHPVDVELVTAESELNSTVCSLMIVLFSVFTITILLNVQQKKQAEELTSLSRQLEQAADHDALTGLYNRRYLNRYLERLAQKGKKDVYAALIDLDFFKKVNDEYGHAFGDEVLIEFARILERNLIADGIAVRFGGEEFMLILPDVTEEEIRHMLAKMSADYRLFGKQKKNRAFTFSCGVEQFADGMDVSDVYRQADEKLYLAKERGRDRVIINR